MIELGSVAQVEWGGVGGGARVKPYSPVCSLNFVNPRGKGADSVSRLRDLKIYWSKFGMRLREVPRTILKFYIGYKCTVGTQSAKNAFKAKLLRRFKWKSVLASATSVLTD